MIVMLHLIAMRVMVVAMIILFMVVRVVAVLPSSGVIVVDPIPYLYFTGSQDNKCCSKQ
jgi:hypothetical protein